MVTKDEAVRSAQTFLQQVAYPDRADSIVMRPDTAIEFTYGWTVRFDFKEHLETGDPSYAPFTSVVVVPHDGSAADFAPTSMPAAEYMALHASGNWLSRKGQ
ncbi:YrhB domain-containing protein [Streptomyces sp. NPDC020755]|uniref:YrhB domain-containing protein n=1 Tax=Streptomyces sp. NPDC020755 TaxID=3154790 RepID=UPI0033FA73FD